MDEILDLENLTLFSLIKLCFVYINIGYKFVRNKCLESMKKFAVIIIIPLFIVRISLYILVVILSVFTFLVYSIFVLMKYFFMILTQSKAFRIFVMVVVIGALSIFLINRFVPAKYTLSFQTNGGSEIETRQLKFGEYISYIEDPTKSGYIFLGWCWDEEFTDDLPVEPFMPEHDTTIYALWGGTIRNLVFLCSWRDMGIWLFGISRSVKYSELYVWTSCYFYSRNLWQ